jgi:hypothetical protein
MAEDTNDAEALGGEEVRQFLQKLDLWADTLNVGEKALLQLVVQRAAGEASKSSDVDMSFSAGGGFGEVIAPFLREVVVDHALSVRIPKDPNARVRGWVQAGEPWIQSGGMRRE